MAKHLDWVFAGIAVAAGYGLVRSLRPDRCEPVIKPGDSVFLVGDSLAVGLGPFLRKLAQERGVTFSASSKTGTMVRHWLGNSAFKAALEQSGASVVLVCLGTNDTYSQLSAADLRADAESMLALARGAGRKVIWILPPKLPKEDRATPAIRDTGVDVFESATLEIPMGGDQIHPTSAGYAMWAGLVWRNATCGSEAPAAGIGSSPSRRPPWLRPSGRSPDVTRTIVAPTRARGLKK